MSDDATLRAALALLAQRIGAGVVILDPTGKVIVANDAAGALLGVPDQTAIAAALRDVAAPAERRDGDSASGGDDSARGGDDVGRGGDGSARAPAGDGSGGAARPVRLALPDGRTLRVERHALPGAAAVVLLEAPAAPGPERLAVVEAARARRDEQLVAGYLHDFNGPLNNFNLTLALLDGSVGRALAAAPGDAALARCQRHVELLQGESRRLLGWSRSVAEGLIAPEVPQSRSELPALLVELARTLRHHAALHEVTITVQPSEAAIVVEADPWQLRLALLHFTSAVVTHAEPGSRITIVARCHDERACIEIIASSTTLPAHALAHVGDVARTPDHAVADLVAGCIAVEAIGGTAGVERDAAGALRIVIELRCLSE